ncbi:uncharacterized membrane protein [Caldisphaera lagunensis DSM 15908]|uniref:Uncharacterized membrane protein n=1 Tax=Caldisphaera lagunensis (strain DSM 15908 / JCM 11604 / ANMR 0165 / IC-154) TaxID=1056495 RepID=L0ACS3_CALLD|nr:stage II sporulation protein M [Caldisphaera lagunensis]AFZ70855.1 uncharacterized membrane protein [Caldisphaera lagunensis DSM 15908]
MGIIDDAVDLMINEKSLRRTWITLIALFGIVGIIIILSYNAIMQSFVGQYLQSQESGIRQIAQSFGLGNSYYLLPFIIFGNNVKTAIITWVSSLTIVIPILIVAVNGGLVGFVLPGAYPNPPLVLFYLLVPHGVIEIPSVTLVSSVFILLISKGPVKMYKNSIGLLLISAIMLAVAAFIESFLTRTIAEIVASML